MAITPVAGASNSWTTSPTTHALTYTPTYNNSVLVAVLCTTNVTSAASLVDGTTGGPFTTFTAGPTYNNNGGANSSAIYMFISTASSTSTTTLTWSWTTSSQGSSAIYEYSNVNSVYWVNNSTYQTFGATSPATMTIATLDANDYIVMGYNSDGSNPGTTASAGTVRERITASPQRVCIVDNTAAAAGNVTCTNTGGSNWVACAIMLRSSVASFVSCLDDW